MHLFKPVVTALALVLGTAQCLNTSPNSIDNPDIDPNATTRILFIGNSLTYYNDLPDMVKALADSAGITGVQAAQVAQPDYALEDHYADGRAVSAIQAGGWHYVALQQGPSSTTANRANLRQWAATFAQIIRSKGGTPAMFQVWPQIQNFSTFDAANESYRLAAEDIDGLLFPAGKAWQAALRRDPSIQLYYDGLHASVIGSYLAALTIFGELFDRSVIGLPGGLRVPSGSFLLTAEQTLLLQQSADEANGRIAP
ncbi:MAG: hypothetical protein HOP28_02410 [Gemmatimonadales bacterium]|nr:hypothetical protein [Gemmatimonadales bacterium]